MKNIADVLDLFSMVRKTIEKQLTLETLFKIQSALNIKNTTVVPRIIKDVEAYHSWHN